MGNQQAHPPARIISSEVCNHIDLVGAVHIVTTCPSSAKLFQVFATDLLLSKLESESFRGSLFFDYRGLNCHVSLVHLTDPTQCHQLPKAFMRLYVHETGLDDETKLASLAKEKELVATLNGYYDDVVDVIVTTDTKCDDVKHLVELIRVHRELRNVMPRIGRVDLVEQSVDVSDLVDVMASELYRRTYGEEDYVVGVTCDCE